ncbi:hypothetical protein NE639_26850, partial [Blautia producta]|nr:hypothetical protein [Blautia producta]
MEIQRFSNGELKLLLINDKVQTSYTTKTDFADTEGWFQIGYNSDDGTVIEEMMGLRTTKPFQTFTEHGFPEELIR